MTLPAGVRADVERVIGAAVVADTPVGGGCISSGTRARLADGTTIFVKWRSAADDMFAAEAQSLAELRSAGTLAVPALLAQGSNWLALEWLDPAPVGPDHAARLADGLVAQHRVHGPGWGWGRDNYIGSLPQPNGWCESWPEFWRERRLCPQFERAAGMLGTATAADFRALLDELDDLLAAAATDGPSLLHGDLWSGNVLSTARGPALVDPACSYGHREVDLAMAALFGGFPADWEERYREAWPLAAGAATRRAVYQLYYLLVHINLFGAGYVERTRATLRRALG